MIVRGEDNLYLYNLTLKKQSNYIHSCIGYFVDISVSNAVDISNTEKKKLERKKQPHLQICIATESHIELYDVSEGNLTPLASIPIFAIITKIESIFFQNKEESVLAVLSDSGVLSIIQFINENGTIKLQTLYNQPLSRTGIRRLSPIYHLNVDPYGRCLLISAMERNKLCFLIDYQHDKFRISSPLEINRPDMIILEETVCDVLYNNPCFASIEIDTVNNNDHRLVFYVLDLSLNHVIKKSDYKIRSTANFLMSLPELSRYDIRTLINEEDEADENINPFVIIGFENFILIKDMNGYYSLKVQIPRRENQQGVVTIISSSIQKLKKDFFILLQTNHGDLLKLTVTADKNNRNRPMASISYFDSIYQSDKLHIFKNGYLFNNSEYFNCHLFQFESLGEDNSASNSCSSKTPEEHILFKPPTTLQNLSISHSLKCLNPLRDNTVSSSSPLTLTYQRNNNICSIKASVEFTSLITTYISNNVKNLWPIRNPNSKFHKILILGYTNSTTMLNIENDSIEELQLEDNPFITKGDNTILAELIGNRSIIQVCENEMHQITLGTENNFKLKLKWYPPAGIRITSAACTASQIALALSNYEIAYFELNQFSDSDDINELQRRIEIGESISCLSFENSLKSKYLAIGCQGSTVKIVSVYNGSSDDFLEIISMQAVMAPVSDIKLVRSNNLNLHVGLSNGVYNTSKINDVDSQIYDTRTRYIGPSKVNLSIVSSILPDFDRNLQADSDDDDDDYENDQNGEGDGEDNKGEESEINKITCVVIHNTQTWLSYEIDSFLYIRPITSESLSEFMTMCNFYTNDIKMNGACGLNMRGELVIGQFQKLSKLDRWFNDASLTSLEIDTITDKEKTIANNENSILEQNNKDSDDNDNDDDDDDEDDEGSILESPSYYTCATLKYDKNNDVKVLISQHLHEKKCVISVTKNGKVLLNSKAKKKDKFAILNETQLLTATLVRFVPSSCHIVLSTYDQKLITYSFSISNSKKGESKFSLSLVHITHIDDKIHSLTSFNDMLLAPIHGNIFLFGLGKKQLLKKSITVTPPSITKVTTIKNWNNQRIVIGDIRESIMMFIFNKERNLFIPVADDISGRATTTVEFLDESTVIGADKYGNIWTLRLSKKDNQIVNESNEEHWSINKKLLLNKLPNIYECPFKFELKNHYFVNDIILKFHIIKSSSFSDRPVIIYTGLQGTIGCLIPLILEKQVSSLASIEMVLSDMDELFLFGNEEQREEKMLTHGEEEAYEDNNFLTDTKDHPSSKMLEGAYSIVQRDHKSYRSYYAPVKNVIDGDLCESFLRLTYSEQALLSTKLEKMQPNDIIMLLNEIRISCL
ncbi:hypothetical protein TPHA_0F03460 [Tetrapisispora phaffii CBS 4417]|uniref:Cleavage/polyadenylation specificity factor A subunit C-terminal domain-containing protein n=1 Tax=Tetrapisispora phaffii (strain ATCC 24235 / CBS 4417 / NBRC 1672 / NRRL Y-8282 / UCD 70-5) TaxID=1071381 RepID=G8BUP0_TETPH|nr:hypothetical protein TPHA_0F03460 [Tetrapisispora phaffii CBS 4417]CCE63826.1 hypothetical protein TPHA_0F03460 [Tetrapisispora phaffii CBS 4417]